MIFPWRNDHSHAVILPALVFPQKRELPGIKEIRVRIERPQHSWNGALIDRLVHVHRFRVVRLNHVQNPRELFHRRLVLIRRRRCSPHGWPVDGSQRCRHHQNRYHQYQSATLWIHESLSRPLNGQYNTRTANSGLTLFSHVLYDANEPSDGFPGARVSIPHMIVIFVVVLVVFGPNKLPELARGLGKLMADFRKASTDFKTAFEEEMRDIERQAREVERKKAEAASAASPAVEAQAATLATASGTETPLAGTEVAASAAADATEAPAGAGATEASVTEAPVVAPVAEVIVARDTETEATAARDPQKPEDADTQEPQRASADH